MVTTNGSYHHVGGKLVGNMMAHDRSKGTDSLLALRSTGEKMP